MAKRTEVDTTTAQNLSTAIGAWLAIALVLGGGIIGGSGDTSANKVGSLIGLIAGLVIWAACYAVIDYVIARIALRGTK
jgi:hypothetical protein